MKGVIIFVFALMMIFYAPDLFFRQLRVSINRMYIWYNTSYLFAVFRSKFSVFDKAAGAFTALMANHVSSPFLLLKLEFAASNSMSLSIYFIYSSIVCLMT